MECKECYSLTRITRNILTVDHVKVMHSSCTDQSKLSVSTWIRPFCSCCRVVCYFPNCSSLTLIAERQNCLPLSWQAYSARSHSLISWKRGAKAVRPWLNKRIVWDRCLRSQKCKATALIYLQSFVRSAQLSACHLLRFVYEISAQFCHNFTTILPLNHFVHHKISQLFVTILVQNTELSWLNHSKYSVGYHDLSVCLWNIALFDFIFVHVICPWF